MGTRITVRPLVALMGLCAAMAGVASCDATPLLDQPGAGGGGGGAGSLVVYGSTTSLASSGAVSAALTLVAEDSACSGTTYGTATGASAADGSYRINLSSSSAQAGCVVVSGLVAGNPNAVTITIPAVSFADSDSVEVNLSFP